MEGQHSRRSCLVYPIMLFDEGSSHQRECQLEPQDIEQLSLDPLSRPSFHTFVPIDAWCHLSWHLSFR